MLSDEEKEKMEELEFWLKYNYATYEGQKNIKTFSMMKEKIETQKKEIEELKDKNKKLQDKAKELKKENQELMEIRVSNTAHGMIEDLRKENKELRDRIREINNINFPTIY